MLRRCLCAIILGVIFSLGTGCSFGQGSGRLNDGTSKSDPARFFREQSSLGVWARIDARYLELMGEKPLSGALNPGGSEVYRVLVETRPHNTPVVVRLSLGADGVGDLVTKVSESARLADVLAVNRESEVSRADVNRFQNALSNSGFWSSATLEPFDIHEPVEMDSPSWTVEGLKNGSYHVVFRTTPRLASLREAAMLLVANLANVDLSSAVPRLRDAK